MLEICVSKNSKSANFLIYVYSLRQDYGLADGDEEPYDEATYHIGLEHVLSQLIKLKNKCKMIIN